MGYDIRGEIQEMTANEEKLGVFVTHSEELYFTDESPEYNNRPGDRFSNTVQDHRLKIERGYPNTSPRFFVEKTVTVVERVEITEDEWLAHTGEERNPH